MSKRPRYASGSGTQGTATFEMPAPRERDTKLVSAEFAEFRKRHIKQNKEIIAYVPQYLVGSEGGADPISTNATMTLTMATVRAEVCALRTEILEVRQRNMALSRELRKRSQAQSRQSEIQPAQRQAIEAILAGVPALQRLLATSLQTTPPTPDSYPDWALDKAIARTPPTVCQMPLIYTSRPAAIAAAIKDKALGTLDEGSECGSEVDAGEIEERDGPILNSYAGLPSQSSQPAAVAPAPERRPRPLPPVLAAVAKSPLLSSPSSRASPRRRSRGGEKARKRRESGLLLPIVPPIPAEHVQAGGSGSSREGSEERAAEVEQDEDAVNDLIIAEDVEEADVGSSKGKERAKRRGSPVKETQSPPDLSPALLDIAKNAQPHLVVPDVRSGRSASEEMGTDDGDGGNGGRGRRSRNSVVSYKEPSLNKKMRKPDGTMIDDPTKASASSSRMSVTSSHTAPSSAASSSADPANLPLSEQSTPTPPSKHDEPTTSSSRRQKSSSSAIASTSIPSAALRRKSTLPRPGRKRDGESGAQTDKDTSDEEGDEDRPPVPRLPRSVSALIWLRAAACASSG